VKLKTWATPAENPLWERASIKALLEGSWMVQATRDLTLGKQKEISSMPETVRRQ